MRNSTARRSEAPTALAILLALYVATVASDVVAAQVHMDDITKIGGVFGNLMKTDDAREMEWQRAVTAMDEEAQIAPPGSHYADRLDYLTEELRVINGTEFNYKVYIDPEVNAWAIGTGDVRVYSGLMDLMSDDELLFVIGHEVGHVLERHSKQGAERRAAFGAGKLLAGYGIRDDQTMKAIDIGTVLGERSFSREQEKEADLFGLSLLEYLDYPLYSGVRAMHRLAEVSDSQDGLVARLLSTHPDPMQRAEILESKLPESEVPPDEAAGGITLRKFD